MREDERPPDERPRPEPPGEPASGSDLLTIGLLVFFVSLVLIVAALLALPMIVG